MAVSKEAAKICSWQPLLFPAIFFPQITQIFSADGAGFPQVTQIHTAFSALIPIPQVSALP